MSNSYLNLFGVLQLYNVSFQTHRAEYTNKVDGVLRSVFLGHPTNTYVIVLQVREIEKFDGSIFHTNYCSVFVDLEFLKIYQS